MILIFFPSLRYREAGIVKMLANTLQEGMQMKVLSASSKIVIGSALEGGFVYLKRGTLTPSKVIKLGKL